VTVLRVHVGELMTGRITDTIPVTSMRWSDTLNGNGSIDVTVAGSVVRERNLRQKTHGARCFLAVERDGRIVQAGPIWSRTWDWEKGELSLGASGLWSYFDHRIVREPFPTTTADLIVTGKSLGGIARALAYSAIAISQAALPVVLPADESGDHTETFPLWKVLRCGEQMRQITQRAVDAPDIQFVPRRKSSDPRYIEWVMRVGTEVSPSLSQGGPDWVFDTSAPKSPVLGVATDEDATGMAEVMYATGNGQEENILMAATVNYDLLALGWPLMDGDESFPTVEDQATLQGHADNLIARAARPIEVYKVGVTAAAAREVSAGDYAQLVVKGDPWLGDVNLTMRVKTMSGDLSDVVTLEMFPLAAAL